MKYAGISFVAAKKLILNVSKIRLRLIFSRASDIPRLFQKAYGKLYTTCGYWESSTYQKRHRCCWFHAVAMFLRSKNSRPEVYTDVHFWPGYFKRLTESMFSKAVEVCASTSCCTKLNTRRFRSGMDAAGSTQ